VLLGNPNVDAVAVLIKSDCLEQCMNLFWEFEWCSMLHQSAANLVVHLFESKDDRAGLQKYFLVRCRLLERLMEAFEVPPKVSNDSTRSSLNTDIDASNKLKELLGVGEPPKDDGNEGMGDGGACPSYGGAVLAMKSLYRFEQLTSSVESERGSESSNDERDIDEDEAGVVVPVSDEYLMMMLIRPWKKNSKQKMPYLKIPTKIQDSSRRRIRDKDVRTMPLNSRTQVL